MAVRERMRLQGPHFYFDVIFKLVCQDGPNCSYFVGIMLNNNDIVHIRENNVEQQ